MTQPDPAIVGGGKGVLTSRKERQANLSFDISKFLLLPPCKNCVFWFHLRKDISKDHKPSLYSDIPKLPMKEGAITLQAIPKPVKREGLHSSPATLLFSDNKTDLMQALRHMQTAKLGVPRHKYFIKPRERSKEMCSCAGL